MECALRSSLRAVRNSRTSCRVTSSRRMTTSSSRLQQNTPATSYQNRRPLQNANSSSNARPTASATQTAQTTSTPSSTTTKSYPRQPPVTTERQTTANPPQEPILDISQSGLSDQPASSTPSEDNVDWTTSFSGLSSQAFSKEAADILLAPIATDDIEIKPDGILYLPEIKYRRILNRAFGPGGWGLAPRGETIVTAKSVTREYALVANGRLVSIARGEQDYFDSEGIPTATEGCKSNALMRCCKDLGVASELWDPRYIRKYMAQNAKEVWVEHAVTKKKKKITMKG